MELMDISDKLADLNWQRNKAWKTPFTAENARPALYALPATYTSVWIRIRFQRINLTASRQLKDSFGFVRLAQTAGFDPTVPPGNGHRFACWRAQKPIRVLETQTYCRAQQRTQKKSCL
jgi:hypothetical protein